MSSPVQVIAPRRHGDARGWFMETYSLADFQQRGITCRFVQDNHSLSVPAFTLRGLHFQRPPYGQDKVVRCIKGRIYDVAVDLREASPTYGHSVGMELSADNGLQLFLPVGFAHGFLTLEPNSEVVYKVSRAYAPESDGGIAWDSAGIAWPLPPGINPYLSEKDLSLPKLSEFASPFSYDGRPLQPLL